MGFDCKYGEILPGQEELWNEKTTLRLMGGCSIDMSDIDEGALIHKSVPLVVDYKGKKAKPVKNIEVLEAAEAGANILKIRKGNLVRVGDLVGNGSVMSNITNIDRSNKDYDVISISLGVTLTLKQVLFEVSGFSKSDGTVNVVEAVTKSGDTVKVTKDSGIVVGDYVGKDAKIGKVEAVNTGDESGDVLTVNLGIAVAAGSSLVVYKAATVVGPKNFANSINYRPVRALAKESITPVYRAFEIMEDNLPYPVSEVDKKSLGDRFMYV